MKVKELERTVNVAWSPPSHHPVLLAAGTAAQQLDASFNTSAALEVYGLNLGEPGLDMELKVTVPSQNRFHKLGWGGTNPGVIVGGCDSGKIQMYSVSKMFSGEESLIACQDRHTGSVRALDFNPFQTNLLASGASDSEIYIWDLNNTSTPMTPGAKPQPFEDVVSLSWNKQVQHILASTFCTRCIVWDLRKNEPIIKLSDSTSRVRWKVLAWHPDVATQLCIASEEDSNPVVQLWDLRFATSPLKSLQGHNRGVLSLSWCSQDPDLLISSAKDNRILCWNPNSNEPNGELVCEIANTQQWIFEVNWCPRNPSLIASCSCDGHASIYSLTGSQNQVQTSDKIADSFPGMEEYSQTEPPAQQPSDTVDLRKAPKWLRRPVGASFGFGGKIVSFGSDGVQVQQVCDEHNLVERAHSLQQSLAEGRYQEICQGKDDILWKYLEASFSPDPRLTIRSLLGYTEEMVPKLSSKSANTTQNSEIDTVTDHMANLNQNDVEETASSSFRENSGMVNSFNTTQNGLSEFDTISSPGKKKVSPFKITTDNGVDGAICKALLVGGIEEAVDICLKEGRMADAIILAMAAGPELLAKTQVKYFQENQCYLSHIIEAVVMRDWKPVIQQADVSSWKEALAAILTYSKDEDLPILCEELGARLEEAGGAENLGNAEICYIASGNMAPLIHKRTSNINLTSDSIQDLVELVLVGQCAMAARGNPIPVVGELASLLAHYSELLAAQGDLDSALHFINNIQEEGMDELRDRLYYALGLKSIQHQTQETLQQQQPPQQQPPQQQPPQQLYARKTSAQFQTMGQIQQPGGMQQVQPQQPPPPQQQPPSVYNAPVPVSSYSGMKVPLAQIPAPGRATPQQNTVAPPPTAAPPPPPASLVRSTPSPLHTQSGLSSKKYVVDPSVQGGYRSSTSHMYSQAGSNQPMPMFPQSNAGFQSYSSAAPGFQAAPFQPSPAPSFLPPAQTPQAVPPYQQQPSAFPPPASTFHPEKAPGYQSQIPTKPPPSFSPAPNQPGSQPPSQPAIFTPQANVGFKPSGGTANMPPPSAQMSAQTNNPSAPGWNDPPAVSGPPRNQPKTELIHQNPITHPLFGAAPPPQPQSFSPQQPQQFAPQQQQPQQFMPQHQPQQFMPQQPPQQFMPQQQPQQFMPQQYNPVPQAQQVGSVNGAYETQTPPQRPQEPPKQKPALPEQYLRLQTVLENLRTSCSSAANNPQLKRKLEEVGRKLEALYDALRDSKLSMETISGLEQMIGLIESGDYTGALWLHTNMVSGSDFSQIASFMPGLKVLIQSALQLNVYLQ